MFSIKSSDISLLKASLFNGACYSFTWHNYLPQSWSDNQNNIAQAIEIQKNFDLIDVKRSNFLSIGDFYTSLDTNEKLKVLMKNDFASFPDKALKSNASNGNFFFKTNKSTHVVTNIQWLSNLIESVYFVNFNLNVPHYSLKNNVPILSKQALVNQLSNLVTDDKVK